MKSYKYFYVSIKAPKNLINIEKKGKIYLFRFKNGKTEEHDLTDTLYAIIGVQTNFLKKSGRKTTGYEFACHPQELIDTLVEDGKPLLSEDKTYECMAQLQYGILAYENKRCKNIDIGNGIGYILYKLYEPYSSEHGTGRIFEKYFNIISVGLFALQLKCKALTKCVYRGLYGSWVHAKQLHDRMFLPKNGVQTIYADVYEDILAIKEADLFSDPLHDPAKYPQNLKEYNIDNLIFCMTAVEVMHKSNTDFHILEQRKAADYIYAHERILEFFNKATPLYKKRCDNLIAGGKGAEARDFPIAAEISKILLNMVHTVLDKNGDQVRDRDGDIRLTQAEKLYEVDVPYLRFTLCIFASDEKYTENPYEYIRKLTGMSLNDMDLDCRILGERYHEDMRIYRRNKRRTQLIGDLILIAVCVAIVAYTIYSIVKFITIPILIMVAINTFMHHPGWGEDTRHSPGTGFFYNLSTGHLEYGWWI